MTRCLSFHRKCFLSEFKAKRIEEYHRKCSSESDHDRPTIRSHKASQYSTHRPKKYLIQDNILRFDISMDNLIRMELIDGRYNLSHDSGDLGLTH